jgi:hypothetical protein
MATLANKSEANQMAFGQHGCVLIDSDADIFIPPDGKVVVSIQCLGDTTFDLLVAEDSNRFISTEASSHSTTGITVTGSGGTATEGAGFIDTTGTPASTLIGKSLYLKSTGAFLAKVKAVGLAANGDVDASTLEMDRDVTIANSAVLAVTDSDEGFGGVTIATANVFPKGITIHGRWTVVSLAGSQPSDGAILYLGPGNYHPE